MNAFRPLLLCAALAAFAPAYAQAPQGENRGGNPQTWAAQQKNQSWAADKLAKSPRRNEWVEIAREGRKLKAWVDYPQAKGKTPVVLVVHEVFGLTDSTRNTADQIAAMGYIAITPDMASGYGPNGGNTDSFPTSNDTSKTVTSLHDSAVNADFDAWADYAKALPGSNGKLAIVGLSWGGGAAFRYAVTQRQDVKGIFVLYDVGPPAITQRKEPGVGTNGFPVNKINVPVYGFYPSKDTRVMNSLQATKEAMAAAHKKFDAVVYEGAEHAYMRVGEDPKNQNPANAAAVKASLARLQQSLKDVLK